MKKITKEQEELLDKIGFELILKNGYVTNAYTWEDVPCLCIAMVDGCFLNLGNSLFISTEFNDKPQYKDISVGTRYLFYNDNDSEMIYAKLKVINQGNEYPFETEKGNKFKFVKELKK